MISFASLCSRALVAVGLLAAGGVSTVAAQDQTFITIGTGGVTGIYYPTGGAICRLVNQNRKDHGIRCSVESTDGSVFNMDNIRSGELDFGVVQSDVEYNAFNGTSNFAEAGPFEKLRAVFSLHSEPFTVVARADAGVSSFLDLKGKRVNFGNVGSGQRATSQVLLDAMGWSMDDFSLSTDLKPTAQSEALCDNTVDAIVYIVGHPNSSIKEATTACDAVLLNVDNPGVDKLVAEHPFYSRFVIPGGLYRGNDKDVTTFGGRAVLVTSADTPERVVYQLVKAVFENLDQLKSYHPVLEGLTKETMVSDHIFVPLHPGARKYFVETGLLKDE